MLIIRFTPSGMSHSDFSMYGVVERLKNLTFDHYKNNEEKINSSTYNIIHAIRVAIYKGYINHDYVMFEFGNRIITVDKTARPTNGSFPSYFLDDALDQLIGIDENIF